MLKKLTTLLLAVLSAAAFGAVDVNTATQAELEAVQGIGPALATRVLTERARQPFKDWGDLIARVSGLGKASAARLSAAGLTVSGTSYSRAAQKD